METTLIELQPRQDTEYVSQSRTVVVTDRRGFISRDSHQGLWFYQSRTLSQYRWTINGKEPQLSAFSPVTENSSLGYYIAAPKNWKETATQESDPAQQSIELRIFRAIGDGMREEITLTNHTQIDTQVALALEVEADFISPQDDPGKSTPIGKVRRCWRKLDAHQWELEFDYAVRHAYQHQGEKGVARLRRGLILRGRSGLARFQYRNGKIRFDVSLKPHGIWKLNVGAVPTQQISNFIPMLPRRVPPEDQREPKVERFLRESAQLRSPASPTFPALVINTLERSRRDLAALRLFDLDGRDAAGDTWIPAAGLPTYVGLFGRDSLASAWQASLLSTAMMRGVASELPKTQGTQIDDWRDEQPGRLVHELHTDPRAVLNFTPHARYYGGVTASIYFPVVVSAIWHWTGNKELVQQHLGPALRGLEWADKYSWDKSGFYKYRTRSEQGEKNQGWKDSDDAIVDPVGSQVKDPLGTCEMQAFAYVSKVQLSEVLWWLDKRDLALRLFRDAEELRKRFNEFFWMEDEGYLGLAINRRNNLVHSIASDPGHCLASGIVDKAHAGKIADRMMKPDLFSGWGIRTLSAQHPAFNPFSYHRGSVWPVENAVFVLAFARYGLHDHMHTLARAFFDTASIFKYYRLPEVFAGHQRDDEHPFPGMYPKANWPQAWSASAPFTVMQALLGLYPYAPLNVLLLDPWLPDWLPEFSIERLHIGQALVSLRFKREENGRTNYEVTDLQGKLHVVRQPSPWSLTAGFGERVRDAVESLLAKAS
jgi:glycogen debranching enzyme